MAAKIKLKVQKRKVTGRKVKTLRKGGIIPANIYGKDVKSLAIQLQAKDFHAAFKQAGETNIIDLMVDKDAKARPVLVHDIHRHPVTDYYLHVDFHQVDLTKKVAVNIPVELTGEAPAVSKGGVLIHQINEVEIEALPADLPDKFELDLSKLEKIGDNYTLKDIKVDPKKVKLMAEDLDEIVVQIEEPKQEEEVTPEAEDVEGTEDAPTAEEGDAEAEGEDPKSKEKGDQKPEAEGEDPKSKDAKK